MIKIKIDKNKLNEPVFKLWFKELNEKEERFLKRVLIESKEIQGSYKYEIPIKFLLPIINNIGKENIKIDWWEIFLYFPSKCKIYEEVAWRKMS